MTDSLLRCTVKKSYDVTKKILVSLLKGTVVIGAVAATGLLVISTAPFVIDALSGPVSAIILTTLGFLASIPLWVWAAIAVPVAIIIYSFLWCVKRDLTSEDWRSPAAVMCDEVLADITIGCVAITGAVIFISFNPEHWPVGIIAGWGNGFLMGLMIAGFGIDKDVYTFFGAVWHHYRHRKDGEKP